MGCDVLVDGYNIIKNSASFQAVEARNLAAARSSLIAQLVNRYRSSEAAAQAATRTFSRHPNENRF